MSATKKPVKITDTTLRDGHQSLLATRMRIEHMLPILEKIDQVGYHSLEVWGGATFDSCIRFLNEDPWERLRNIKKHCKTPLQMLLRGQNIVGYKNYPDDVLTEFIKKTVANGLDIFRIFDALNDVRNMQKAMEVAKKEGAHVQAVACYTISPVHNVEYYVNLSPVRLAGKDGVRPRKGRLPAAGLLPALPLFQKFQPHFREEGHGNHVFFLLQVRLRQFPGFFQTRRQHVGRPAGNRLFVADNHFLRFFVDGRRWPAVIAADIVDRFVAVDYPAAE